MKRRNTSAAMMVKDSNDIAGKQIHQYALVSSGHRKRGRSASSIAEDHPDNYHDDTWNYALLLVLYTLQGIPMGLSASIPFLIQQKIKTMAETVGAASAHSLSPASAAAASRLSYNANAIFALSSWPFSLKLLWAPVVDAIYVSSWGRRKTWLLPVQICAGIVMVFGANFVERQLSLSSDPISSLASEASTSSAPSMNVAGVTSFFFLLYFLMATQDIAVDGWALTMLSKINRGRGPICNSIGQNIGYFLSFTGFLAFNDAEAAETLWRPLFGWPNQPGVGLITLGGFIRAMGFFILITTILVAWLKPEKTSTLSSSDDEDIPLKPMQTYSTSSGSMDKELLDEDNFSCLETYRRLWAVCKLPAVRVLFFILLTYRLPTSLSDNVKFLKAVEFGLPKSTTALLSPTVILPLGIITPIVANRIWHGHPMRQFMIAYIIRVTIVPCLDFMMLLVVRHRYDPSLAIKAPLAMLVGGSALSFWFFVISSTAAQAIVQSLQFNAQMTFFASRADPAIGGSYMTLMNTAANMGGTWPSSIVMWMLGALAKSCQSKTFGNVLCSIGGISDPYFALQIIFAVLGLVWIMTFGRSVDRVALLPDDAWRTHIQDNTTAHESFIDIEAAVNDNSVTAALHRSMSKRE